MATPQALNEATGLLPGIPEPPAVIAPDTKVFARRARRFAQLAEGHALGDWLRFLGQLAQAQHAALQDFPLVPLPASEALARAREHAIPPLSSLDWPRDGAWRMVLRKLIDRLVPEAPEASRTALGQLRSLPDHGLESHADQLLAGCFAPPEAALLPFVAAGLEVYWTAMASRLGSERIHPLDVRGVCPACGFLPVASVVHGNGDTAKLRYLHCALCNTEWNLVRVTCAACEATAGVAYQQIAEGDGAVRAETCDGCHGYLKIMYRTHAPLADPVADDLATLALDLLVDELGYQRTGPNLFFVPGEG